MNALNLFLDRQKPGVNSHSSPDIYFIWTASPEIPLREEAFNDFIIPLEVNNATLYSSHHVIKKVRVLKYLPLALNHLGGKISVDFWVQILGLRINPVHLVKFTARNIGRMFLVIHLLQERGYRLKTFIIIRLYVPQSHCCLC